MSTVWIYFSMIFGIRWTYILCILDSFIILRFLDPQNSYVRSKRKIWNSYHLIYQMAICRYIPICISIVNENHSKYSDKTHTNFSVSQLFDSWVDEPQHSKMVTLMNLIFISVWNRWKKRDLWVVWHTNSNR